MSICTAFGKPGEGIHSYRIPIVNLAAVDVLLTVIAGMLISYASGHPFIYVFFALMIVGIVSHSACGVKTALNTSLNL